MALVFALVWGTSGTFAADVEQAVAPPTASEPSMSVLPPPTGQAQSIDQLLEPGQIISSYSCSPGRECAYRACLVGPPGKYWFRADYLLWWTEGVKVVPLVTTSNAAAEGILGDPSTRILFGNERINGEARSNFRIRFGTWFHCGRTSGVEFDYFTLGESGTNFFYGSDDAGQPLYARPFYDVNPNNKGMYAQQVANPEWVRGSIDGRIDEYFQSAGVNLRLNLCCNECCSPCCEEDCCEEDCYDEDCVDGCEGSCNDTLCGRAAVYGKHFTSFFDRMKASCKRVDFIAGYRHYQLSDSLRIHEDLTTFRNHGYIRAGSTFDIVDEFRSRNDFHGGELGLVAQFYRGCWSLELLAKMALGNNHRVVKINGHSTIRSYPDVPASYDAGIMALETNSGRYTSDKFVVIPQFGAEIGCQVNCHLRAYVGYNLILWNDVARGPQQVDFVLNSSYFPGEGYAPSGEARPSFDWRDSDFWAQGMNFGLEYRF